EHHNNNEFNCCISNLSFASNDINLAKAHTLDKTQPILLKKMAVNFFKDFNTQKYQITLKCNDDYYLTLDNEKKLLDRIYLVYDDNFRVVYTDANRIVDELLETGEIDFKLLSYNSLDYTLKVLVYSDEEITEIQHTQDKDGNFMIIVPDSKKDEFFFNSIPPKKELYEKDE
ncbi:hypothetical protein PaeCFBP13512_22595, partial [Paenibacillus sp. CFBP13512]|uniref:hypothetical protein n=1 Tax=Paenibacillus sp. CFBP13512 TaxID=2184007 RepID=UPI00113BE0DF